MRSATFWLVKSRHAAGIIKDDDIAGLIEHVLSEDAQMK
jgi:hypothetical protein